MAVLVTATIPNGTQEIDEQMQKTLNLQADPPAGALVRVAGPIEGGFQVVSVWESQQAFDAFRNDRLAPAWQAMGRELPQFNIQELASVQINRT